MQPDSERSILLQDTQIYAVGLMVWHLLLNSASSWIPMKMTFFFSSAAGAVTALRGFINSDVGINEVIPIFQLFRQNRMMIYFFKNS